MGSRIRNWVLKAGLVGALALPLGAGGLFYTAKKTNLFDGRIPVEASGRRMDVPVYNHIKLKPESCSSYARMAADDIFGENFAFSNAWDRRYKDKLVCEVESNEQLAELAEQGTLQPGMIVGVFYPRSRHLNDKDMHGNLVPYTHNMLYLGVNEEEGLVFAEQFGARTRTRTLEQFAEHGLQAREIIAPRRNGKDK